MDPPTKEVLDKVRSEFGLTEQRVREAIEHLKHWIQLQPHLPKEIVSDDGRLERWLIRCKDSIEKVKKTLDLYYTLRTNLPDVMTGWDTKGDWFKIVINSIYIFPMPQLTTDCDRVVVFGLPTSDSTEFNMLFVIKLYLMMMEINISKDYCSFDIYVVDWDKISLGHISKLTPSYLKKMELCGFSGYNVRIKAMHFLNAPPLCDVLVSLFRLIFKSKLAGRIQVHGSDWTSFYEQVPKDVLPTEHGGEASTIAKNWDLWKKKLESYQDIFLER